MREKEKTETITRITTKVKKRGIPINVRTGGNEDAAEWVGKLLEELLENDEPSGTIEVDGRDRCPACRKMVGISGFYCKWCGSQLREVIY